MEHDETQTLDDNGTSWNSIAKHLHHEHGYAAWELNYLTYVQLDSLHKDYHGWLLDGPGRNG